MLEVKRLVASAFVVGSLGFTAGPASAQNTNRSYQPSSPGGTSQPVERRGDYRPNNYDRNGGYRAEVGRHYREGHDAQSRYDARHDGRYIGYGRDGQGWRNGYYPSHGYPAAAYRGYGYGPLGYAPLRGYGPVGFVGWAHGGVYAPAVVVPAPAYRGWGAGYGYGYIAAPVVVAVPVYRGWGYRGY